MNTQRPFRPRLAFASDGKTLAKAAYWDAKLWEVRTAKELTSFKAKTVVKGGTEYLLEQLESVAFSPDGKTLAVGSASPGPLAPGVGYVSLWDISLGQKRATLRGHKDGASSVAFSPDGQVLATGSHDNTVYLWEIYALEKAKLDGEGLTQEERKQLWRQLADPDAAIGFQAMCELLTRPSEAAALLEEEWRPTPRASPPQIKKWVEDLGSDHFSVRETASAELDRFAAQHEIRLREALRLADSLEVRKRLEKILVRLGPERLRRSRMLEVLEQLRNYMPGSPVFAAAGRANR